MSLRAPFVRLAGGRLWPLPVFVLLVILSAATYGAHNSSARYGAVQAGFTPEMAPPEDLRRWQHSSRGLTFSGQGANTEVSLAARHERGVAAVQAAIVVPEGADGLRVELRIGTENLEPGGEPWQNARLQFLSFGRAGNLLWYWPKDIIVVSADRPLGPVSATMPLREDLKGVLVRIYNGADSGVLRIGLPKIVPVYERPAFAFLRGALILTWIAAGLWAAWAVARRASTSLRFGALLSAAVLALAGTLAPQPAFRTAVQPVESLVLEVADSLIGHRFSSPPQSRRAAGTPSVTGGGAEAGRPADRAVEESADSQTSKPAAPERSRASKPTAPELMRVVAPPPPDYPFSFKEAGHFFVFLLLGIACFAAFPRSSWYGRTLCLVSFAVATESLQWFVVTRSSSVTDLAVDTAGLALAAAVTATSSWITAAVRARNRGRALPGARS